MLYLFYLKLTQYCIFMTLYERNFKCLNEDEVSVFEKLKDQEKVVINGKKSDTIRRSLYTSYPTAVRHYLSLFPNNFLDSLELKNESDLLDVKIQKFSLLLDNNQISERHILSFIKENKAYFIIGSILKHKFPFGHHALFIFPEFKLAPDFQVDYLIVGKNSDGHHFVFVELENPYGPITLNDGSFGETIRKGIRQIENWETWLEANFSHLRLIFNQALGKTTELPKEFTVFDKTRIHFVVVAGRRINFNEKTYRLQRSTSEQRKLHVFHYDNLIDLAKETVKTYSF